MERILFLEHPTSPHPHELELRFELSPAVDWFFFFHHGLNVADLAATVDLSLLGQRFMLADMRAPVALSEVVSDPTLLNRMYGVEPAFESGIPVFDVPRLSAFFLNALDDDLLDCMIVEDAPTVPSPGELARFLSVADSWGIRRTLFELWRGQGSMLGTHDNHFCWISSPSIPLLRRLIAESIIGFFYSFYSYPYHPIPPEMVDLLLVDYHTVSLICEPWKYDALWNGFVPSGDIQVDTDTVSALIETTDMSWLSDEPRAPARWIGRGLLISYDLHANSWSWERWEQ